MASQGISKKRPAPGTSPTPYHTSYPPPSTLTNYGTLDPGLSDEQFLQYGYQLESDRGDSPQRAFPTTQRPDHDDEARVDSSQLARRPANQMVPRDWDHGESPALQSGGQLDLSIQRSDNMLGNDLHDLKQKAQVAKIDAQSKRKQIPPFVQKLASFLDDGKNTNLIRWSDDGGSLIVEDEDEFAKTLIPELFKHNNYASFVRQLNMYGFHKKVGLSDNSMRASEKKSKSPSEYSNLCFRRGQPDLLWLIRKSKNTRSKVSKKTDHDLNEDDIDEYIEDIHTPQDSTNQILPRFPLAIEQNNATLPSDQLTDVHRELQMIRRQQSQITNTIKRLRLEHEQLYGQAATFQDHHSRHENSINAILTFLATIYNRSLQGHEGLQGIANLFSGALPQDANQSHVLDVGDYTFDHLNGLDGSMQRQPKKQPLLLKAAPADSGRVPAASPPSGPNSYQNRQTGQMSASGRNGMSQSGNVEELLDVPNQQLRPQPSNQPEHQARNDILSVIQNSNARNSSPASPEAEFSNVLSSLESSGGRSPLTNTQRADMLRLISNQGSPASAGENALTPPDPSPVPNDYNDRLAATRSDLDNLAKMQADQDRSVQNLTNILQPLSPTGSIPGIGDGTDVQPPPLLDIDDFLNSTANYFTEFPPEPNYNLNDSGQNSNGSGYVQTRDTGANLADFNNDDDELFRGVVANNYNNDLTIDDNNDNDNGAFDSQNLPQSNTTGYRGLNLDGQVESDDRDDSNRSMPASGITSPTDTLTGSDADRSTPRSSSNNPVVVEQQLDNDFSPNPKRKRLN